MSESAVTIDLAALADVSPMLSLSNEAAATTPANFATTPETVSDWTDAWVKTSAMHPWLVARRGGKVVGFAKASPHRARGAYQWTAEVSVYVDRAHHRAGVGKALYRHLIAVLRRQGYATLLAGITPPNDASERLHASLGFRRCGVYHHAGFKFGKWHDVGYWELHLVPTHLAPSAIEPVSGVWPAVRDFWSGATAVRIERTDLTSEVASTLIRALNQELAAMYPEPGANHFGLTPSQVAADRGGFFVTVVGDTPVGCGALRVEGDTAELKRMFVVPRWRGCGLSGRMLRELEVQAQKLGVTRVVLETGERQTAALALYRNAGYQQIERFGEYVDSPLSICLEKMLSGAERARRERAA